MKQINLQDVGLTDRYNRNRAQSNFKAVEDAVNSNAITAEEMYAELNGKLAAEANARKAGDDSEARDRQAADQALGDRIDEIDERLDRIEKMLYGSDPQSIEHTEPADVLDGVKIVEINK